MSEAKTEFLERSKKFWNPGELLMILGQFNHELIAPFSHGIELRPGKGYSYIVY